MAVDETVEVRSFQSPANCPVTHYFVAFVYQHAATSRLYLATHVEYVTGDNPLKLAEVIARAKAAVSATWKEQKPDLGDESAWNASMFNVRFVVSNPTRV